MITSSQIVARQKLGDRMAGLKVDRYSWWLHWRELADYILPRRYKWLVTPNQANRGAPINQTIIDSTGTLAARTLASGMMSAITSPTRPWFKLKLPMLADLEETDPVSIWLAQVETLMMRVFQESNFYNAMAVLYFDLVVFGTGVMIIDEDYDNVIDCYNPCAGEYYIATSGRYKQHVLFREFVNTIAQAADRFGVDNLSTSSAQQFRTGGASLSQEVLIFGAIMPNDPAYDLGVPSRFPYVEVYWEPNTSDPGKMLEIKPRWECPFIGPRWDVTGNDSYGRSPGMDALGDIKQLQQETKRKAQAIDKMVNPPLLADVNLKNQPASMIPGGVTYVAGLANSVGVKPVYEVMPPIGEMTKDIQEIQSRIKEIFHNPLFTMISQLDTVRTATEINALREEKLVLLGPVLERLENEALTPIIERTFAILSRGKILPPPPQAIQGQHLQISFVSMLAEAQRAVASSGIDKWLSVGGNLAAVDPTIMDNYDLDETVDYYAGLMAVPPKLVRQADKVAALRAQRAQQQQQTELSQQTLPAVKGAQVLSNIPMPQGGNALQAMTNGQ